jgi:hypothetical protein
MDAVLVATGCNAHLSGMSPNARRPQRKAVNPIDSAILILLENCAMVLSIDAEPSHVPPGTLFLTGSLI